MSAYAYIFLTIVSWGIWGFLGKLATKFNHPLAVSAISYCLFPFAALSLFLFLKTKTISLNTTPQALILVTFTSIFGILGGIFYYVSLSKLPASIAVSLTALYPAVTLILSLFLLKETPTPIQWIGIVCSLIGTYCLTYR